MMRDPDEAIASVEEDIRHTKIRAERMIEVRQAMETVAGEATSRTRDVAVKVDLVGEHSGVDAEA